MQKLTILPEERPVAIQIYGKDPQTMVEAAKIAVNKLVQILWKMYFRIVRDPPHP